MRYNPVLADEGRNPFLLDSPKPDETWREYTKLELRYRMLQKAHPEEAERMLDLGQRQVERRYAEYAEMASRTVVWFASVAFVLAALVSTAAAACSPGTYSSDGQTSCTPVR